MANTYTLIASKNNIEGDCCKLENRIIYEGTYRDYTAPTLQTSCFTTSFMTTVTLPIQSTTRKKKTIGEFHSFDHGS